MGESLVSVVVPAWNAERTLAETLQSVAAQTHRDLQILIVDDGSTDATARVAADFCEGEPRARLLPTRNSGVAAARNRGIAEAAGTWIAPIDADDLWHPTKIEKQIAAARAAPERPGFVYCWHRLIDEAGQVTGSGPQWELAGRAFNRLAYVNVVENGSALLLSREAVLAVGGYDESLRARDAQGCEDVMLQLRIARRYAIAVVPEYLVGHRRHNRNMSGDFEQIYRSWRLVYGQLVLEQPPILPTVLRWVQGKSAFDNAERSAAERRRTEAVLHVAAAIVRDPKRCGALLAYRLARSASRAFASPRSDPKRRIFSEVDPREDLPGDPHELRAFLRRIHRLNLRRLRRLEALDEPHS